MGLSLCKCFCHKNQNRIDDSINCDYNILLLGLENAGKTDIACILAGKRRTIYEPTNGVQCYRIDMPNHSMIITEIGGNKEMQKLWHHYYMKTMALIFCYDMSANIQQMEKSFQLLNQIASHPFMRGKAILLVGTKSDLASDTIQLYDIENTFALEALANRYFSSLKSTHFNPNEVQNLWSGINWLASSLESNYKRIKGRINYDMQKKCQPRRKKFSLSYRRPKTAPANLSPECTHPHPPVAVPIAQQSKNVFRIAETNADEVPTTSELS